MRTKTLIATLAVAALVLLAGCSGILGSAEFESSVGDIDTAVVDEEHDVTVSIENIGDADGETEVWYAVGDGETYTETVSLDDGESTTVTFTHAFEDAGEHDVVVNNESATVTVLTPLEAAEMTMDDVSTMTADGDMVLDVVIDYIDPETNEDVEGEMLFDYTFDTTYDFDSEELYTVGDTEFDSMFGSMDVEFEEWYVDGALYEKEEGGFDWGSDSDEVEYSVSEKEFDEVVEVDIEEFLAGLSDAERSETADSYVYTVSHEDEAAMETFFNAVEEEEGFFEEDDVIESLFVEVTVAKGTYHVTSLEMKMDIEDEDDTGESIEGELTYTVEYADFDEPVDIELPEEVRDGVVPSASVHVTQDDAGTVLVRVLEMDNAAQLRIEVEGETVNQIRWEGESPVWSADSGDEVVVIAEPEADDVLDEVIVETYVVPDE